MSDTLAPLVKAANNLCVIDPYLAFDPSATELLPA